MSTVTSSAACAANIRLGRVGGCPPSRRGRIRRIHAPMYHEIGVRTGAVSSTQAGWRITEFTRLAALRTGDGICGNSLVFGIIIICHQSSTPRPRGSRMEIG